MSLKHNLAIQNAQSVKSGQVVELLLDQQGELIDYSYSYPTFHHKKKDDEIIQYGIYLLRFDSSLYEIESHRFLTAEKAEDFLIDIDFSDYHPHSVPQSKIISILDVSNIS